MFFYTPAVIQKALWKVSDKHLPSVVQLVNLVNFFGVSSDLQITNPPPPKKRPFHFLPASQHSAVLSQLRKRHEINVMSMAFSHETPRHLVKVTLHGPLSPWQNSERETKDVCLLVQTDTLTAFFHYFFTCTDVRRCWLDIFVLYLTSAIVTIQTCNLSDLSARTNAYCEVGFFFIAVIFEVISTYFLVSWSLRFSPTPQPKQGASSM